MIFFRLIVKTAEDIRTYCSLRQYATDGGNTVKIPLARVFTVHQFENLVATTLNGQVNELAKIVVSRYYLERLIGHILWVRRCKSDTHLRNSVCHHS